MSSQPPLSPAEQAAAEALHRHFVETDTLDIQSINPDDFACEARAVVAAVRGSLYREVADQIRKDWPKSPFVAQKIEKLAEVADGHGEDWSDWQDGDDGPSCKCGFNGTPKECASSRKASPLSRPTSEETQ